MIRVAEKIARSKSRHACHKHAVLICRGRRIIATGHNHGEIHAEAHALARLAPGAARGCDVVSVRVTRALRFGTARPCPECWAALREAGVRRVHYTVNGSAALTTERVA